MSAVKRVSVSTVNWAKLAQHTPANLTDVMRTARSRCDNLVARVNSLPAEKPAIDWAHFAKTVPAPGLVDKFRKEYEALQVPYPRDSEGWHQLIDEQEKYQSDIVAKSTVLITGLRDAAKAYLQTLDEKIPHRDEWTLEMVSLYFPGVLPDPNKPDIYNMPDCPEYREAPNLNRTPGAILSKF